MSPLFAPYCLGLFLETFVRGASPLRRQHEIRQVNAPLVPHIRRLLLTEAGNWNGISFLNGGSSISIIR